MENNNSSISYFFKVMIPSLIIFFVVLFVVPTRSRVDAIPAAYLAFGLVYALDYFIAYKRGQTRKIIFIDPVTGMRTWDTTSFWSILKFTLWIFLLAVIAIFSIFLFILGLINFIIALVNRKKGRDALKQQ